MDEIPVAKREVNPEQKISRVSNNIILIFAGSIIFLVAAWFVWNSQTQQSSQNNSEPVVSNNSEPETTIEPVNTNTPVPSESSTDESVQESLPENILGHLPYEQAPDNDLKAVNSNKSIRLRSKAAAKFKQMQQDAKREGITLVPLSGFRTLSEQEYLFFEIKAKRKQGASKRAEVSAPPGYSEHHTGYAIDIGDANVPATNLSPNFDQTPAYRWLKKNAPKYSFELSFPKDNLQGISYEPWHWRYVGDTHSLETFYKVRQLKTNLQK